MIEPNTFFVGSEDKVACHAAPLQSQLNVKVISADEIERIAKPSDLAIFCIEHFSNIRTLIPRLHKANVATLYAIDGILEWRNAWENREDEPASPWTMRPALSHKVACIGNAQARILQNWGNAGKVEVVGVPRFESLVNNFHKNKSAKRNDNEFRPLIMTAKWPGFTPEQFANAERSLADLRDFFATNTELGGKKVRPVWRVTHGLDEKLGVQNSLTELTGKDLRQVLENVDAVISTPSTALLEGMLNHLPVAMLEYNNCPHYVPTAWQITSKDQIAKILSELVSPNERKMELQKFYLRDNLQVEKPATEQMCKLITSLHSQATECIKNGQQIQFSPNIMKYEGAFLDFDHQKMYPHQPAFQISDLNKLQIQFGDATRKIEQLRAELKQAKKELGQAHEILFSIERHPIAGPVIKMRKKIVAMFSKLRQPRMEKANVKE